MITDLNESDFYLDFRLRVLEKLKWRKSIQASEAGQQASDLLLICLDNACGVDPLPRTLSQLGLWLAINKGLPSVGQVWM